MNHTAPRTGRWPTRRLGDILIRHNEVVHPGQRAGEAPFVGLEHIEPNSGRRMGSSTIDLGNLTGRKPTFRRGQIVYGYLRPYLNKVWVAEFDGYSSVDQFAFDVRPELADTEFVASFMRSEIFLRRASIVTTTGQLPRIGTEEIAAVPIALPPVDIQRCIASALAERQATATAARRAAEERLAAVRSLPAAFVRNLFERPDVRNSPRVPFGDITSKIGSGTTPRGGQAVYVDSGVPLIRSQNVHQLEFRTAGLAHITSEQDREMVLSRVHRGDVLLNITGASIGRACVVPDDVCPANVNQHVSIIRARADRILPGFIAAFLASPDLQHRIRGEQTGATRQALTKEDIESFFAPAPPIDVQQACVRELDTALGRVRVLLSSCGGELASIEALPASLFRAVFDGAL